MLGAVAMAKPNADRVVMIAVDESANSERAFDDYVQNIHKSDDKVLLFHAYEVRTPTGFAIAGGADFAGGFDAAIWELEIERSQQRVENLKSKYKTKCDSVGIVQYDIKVGRAPAGEAIVDAAKQNGVQLIVIGTRGMGTLRRTILGSISDYVVHHAPVPTMVVPCRM